MQLVVAVLACLVMAGAVAAYWVLQRRVATFAERLGRVVYAGDDASFRMLRNDSVGLRGRPDFVVKRGPHGGIWWSAYRPVEYKTAARPDAPRARDVAQLAAYGLLVQAEFGTYPRTGFIQYADGAPFRIRLGAPAERQIRRILATMRTPDRYPARVPVDPRCSRCLARDRCPIYAATH
jgi:CRISPR/Cas system-associated exonuclease Cas4 (RecB family)